MGDHRLAGIKWRFAADPSHSLAAALLATTAATGRSRVRGIRDRSEAQTGRSVSSH
jgi:hypothetical protein